MLLKGKQADSFARKPKANVWAVVAFGDDDGLIHDAARTLLNAWTPKGATLDVTVLDDDAIKKEPGLLFDALEAVSLLGDPRAIRVRSSGDKISSILAEAFKAADQSPGRYAAKLIVEAGALASKSKLRKAAQDAETVAALQLFSDESGDVEAQVQAALLEMGSVIDGDALSAFVGDLPGHRAIANAEIEKLALYSKGLGRNVCLSDVRNLSATDIEHDLSTAIRATLDGDLAAAHTALDRLSIAGTSGISILRALQRETLRMLDAHEKMAAGMTNPSMKLRPPVWSTEWPAYRKRLSLWPTKRLMRVMERIYDAEQAAKSSGLIADVSIRVLMNELARVAELAR